MPTFTLADPAGPAPDPEGVADDILNGGGEAPGSSTERVRRFRARKRGEPEVPEPTPVAPVNVTPKETGVMVSALWDSVVIPLAGKRRDGTYRLLPMSPEQELRMGEAYTPLVQKYLPLVAAWQVEIAALIVTVAVVRECVNVRPVEVVKPNYDAPGEVTADAAVPVASAS